MSDNEKFSAPYREMAERIDRIKDGEFSGAVLIVPPTGDVIAVAIADPKQDLEAFWALVSGKVMIATAEQQESRRSSGAAFRR